MNQDYSFYIDLMQVTKFSNIPRILHKYRIHEKNISNSNEDLDYKTWKDILSKFLIKKQFTLSEKDYQFIYKMKYPSFKNIYSNSSKEVDKTIQKIIFQNRISSTFDQENLQEFFNNKKHLWIDD